MNYTQAQIDRANAVSLEDFLRTQGETLIKSGREYRWKEHDSLTVRGNKWFRHSQSKGGYPIDFVMEFYGKSFPEAVQLLTGESAEGQSEASTAPPTAFHLPLHNRTADRAIQYLCESRGLNKTLVEAFLLSGDIYEDAKRHNVVFVGRDRSGTPRYAHVRGTADPFRQDIAGSDKSYPFHYEGNGNQLFVFEAPIDLLSFICLYPQDWQTRNYLALGGVSGKALDRFLSERKDTRKVFLCLDSDTAGSEACTRLAQDIPGEIAVIRLVPARKDWNDVLRQQGDIPSRKFIAETITLRELPTAQPVPMLRMADVELTSVDWLWFPYIPFGKLTIIQGNPGEGKTYFAMRLAAACTNRKPLPGMETLEPFNIIYQTAEDGLGDTIKPRLMEAEADLDRILVIDESKQGLSLSDERIERAIRQTGARLIILDPIQAYVGEKTDMNKANEIRPMFRRLADVAERTGCAVILIGHLNKAAGGQSAYRGLGSIDFRAAARSVLLIGRVKREPNVRVIVHDKSSLAPEGKPVAFIIALFVNMTIKLLIQQNEIGGKRKTAAATKQLEQAQERIAEVSRIIKRLYEDNVNGKISDERFMELSADYEQEQRELKDRAAALQEELSKSQAATVNAEKFMGIVRKHLAFEELTPTLLREMIEKIVVHECSYDENGTRRQDIEIYYSFVGKIDLPEA